METGKEDTAVFLDRASRSTRGRRMTKLLDEEVEEDEMFWNQEAFKEEENDANYEEEPEAADVFDSDFDEDEPEPDEEVEDEADERVRTKKRLIFPGKPSLKKKKKKKVHSNLDGDSKDENLTQKTSSTQHHDAPDDAEDIERTLRRRRKELRKMASNGNDPGLNDNPNGQDANPPVRRVIPGMNDNLNGQCTNPHVSEVIDDPDRPI
ncbi:hypothetical protein GOBAR_AA30808 [Gossypium barbadense]|uniref:Vps72/YL1 N-terminal domain-containing protein n=1 Tax=Gossypium barbadense TaxID=3634 RepID=A0A2P5WFK5_GOSBA|nr:hypothetical protein GOBAR_AA30808 [Gossypium barbadense]